MSPRPPSSSCTADVEADLLIMTQLYLCEEPYWSKYDAAATDQYSTNGNISINVISDGKGRQFLDSLGDQTERVLPTIHRQKSSPEGSANVYRRLA
jgi:hypothetical protein